MSPVCMVLHALAVCSMGFYDFDAVCVVGDFNLKQHSSCSSGEIRTVLLSIRTVLIVRRIVITRMPRAPAKRTFFSFFEKSWSYHEDISTRRRQWSHKLMCNHFE